MERQVEGRLAAVTVNLQVQFAVRAFLKVDAPLRGDGNALDLGGDGDQTGLAAGEDGSQVAALFQRFARDVQAGELFPIDTALEARRLSGYGRLFRGSYLRGCLLRGFGLYVLLFLLFPVVVGIDFIL